MELVVHTGTRPVEKLLCAMRLSFFLMLGTALHLSAASYSQQVSLTARDLPLEKVFSIIEQQTGYSFIYNDQLIVNSGTVSVNLQHVTLEKALDKCLEGKALSYAIRYKTVIIRKTVETVQPLAPPPGLVFSGEVRDQRNRPLEGASVLLTGAGYRRGTMTDARGFYSLQNLAEGAYTLEVSMIGYGRFRKTFSLRPPGLNAPVIILKDSVMTDKEVVINGIYQRPAENYTGAAKSYTAAQLQQVSSTSIFTALRSLDASFQMPSDINFGSDPNHMPVMQVRGANGVSNTNLTSQYGYISNPPLFILDGFEVTQEKIFDLDMGRVKKVTILKDAAATSIYGSRAANGVLVIETTQPQKGKLRLSYGNSLGVTTPDLTSYHLLNARQKLQLEQYAGIYRSSYPSTQQGLNELYDQRLAEVQRGVNTYWLSQPLATEFSQKHNLFLEGGDDYMRYGVDASYNNNSGVMKGSSRNTLSGGVNLMYHKDNLQFTNYLSVTSNKSVNSPYGNFSQYSLLNPYWKVSDSSGRIAKELKSILNDATGVGIAGYIVQPHVRRYPAYH
ncbi:MAG TPA: carboxypeptidase regulatory-like domain-containing protein [Chitinophaga sp.]